MLTWNEFIAHTHHVPTSVLFKPLGFIRKSRMIGDPFATSLTI